MAEVLRVSGGTITMAADVTVDGVVISTLETDYTGHQHSISDTTEENTSQDPLPVQVYGGSAEPTLKTASNASGDNEQAQSAQSNPSATPWDHTHDLSGTSDTETDGAHGSAGTGGETRFDASAHDIDCDTIDGVAPEVLYDKYDGHYHDFPAGVVQDEAIAGIKIRGATNNSKTYFRFATGDQGENATWAEGRSKGGAEGFEHTHTTGTLKFAAYSAPSQPARGSGDIRVDASGHAVTLGGRVNDIDIGAFDGDGSSHEHNGGGTSGSYGVSDAQVYGIISGSLNDSYNYVQKSDNTWIQIDLHADAHTHDGGAEMTCGGGW